jgi:signal transduction histidine kinase
MLRNMRFRSKLISILVVPIVALVAIAGTEAWSRHTESQRSEQLGRLVDLKAASDILAHSLELEEVATVHTIAGDVIQPGDLEQRRADTDHDIVVYRAALDRAAIPDSPLAESYGNVDSSLETLASVRELVDSGDITAEKAVTSYGGMTSALVALGGGVANASEQPHSTLGVVNAAALSSAKDATVQQWAILSSVLGSGGFEGRQQADLTAASQREQQQLALFDGTATTEQQNLLHDALSSPEADLAARTLSQAMLVGSGVGTSPEAWDSAMSAKVDDLRTVEMQLTDDLATKVYADAAASSEGFRLYLAAVLIVICLSLVMAIVVSRAITRPLRRLTSAADLLAEEQLPRLVESLRSPGEDDVRYLAATIKPLDTKARDEIGRLTRAFNTVQTVAVDVAAEQAALLRKGIGDLFVNLARRNQALVDRQLEELDRIELAEKDPDKLAQLFTLDHIATRMRRNAESLLVLAGVESPRRRGRPVPLIDVVRAAIGEVEDYSRVDITALDEGDLSGSAGADVAHVLAELIENAANFSPPETRVRVEGHAARQGYILTIADNGIGMSPAAVNEANVLLSQPPLVGLALTRPLGFVVIGRLAARLGLSVRLMARDEGGMAAVVALPRHLLVLEGDDAMLPPAPAESIAETPPLAGAVAPPEEPVVEAVPEPDMDEMVSEGWTDDDTEFQDEEDDKASEPVRFTEPPPSAPPQSLLDAVPQGRAFDEGLASLISGDLAETETELVEPPVQDVGLDADASESIRWALDEAQRNNKFDELFPPRADELPVAAPSDARPNGNGNGNGAAAAAAAAASATAATGRRTEAGLVRRVRAEEHDLTDDVIDDDAEPSAAVVASRRSPEEVRALLSRYRSGLDRGRAGDGTDAPGEPAPPASPSAAGEGSE